MLWIRRSLEFYFRQGAHNFYRFQADGDDLGEEAHYVLLVIVAVRVAGDVGRVHLS